MGPCFRWSSAPLTLDVKQPMYILAHVYSRQVSTKVDYPRMHASHAHVHTCLRFGVQDDQQLFRQPFFSLWLRVVQFLPLFHRRLTWLSFTSWQHFGWAFARQCARAHAAPRPDRGACRALCPTISWISHDIQVQKVSSALLMLMTMNCNGSGLDRGPYRLKVHLFNWRWQHQAEHHH